MSTASPVGYSTSRLAYLDWLRGLAVLIMIEAHVVDAWTRVGDRSSTLFWLSIVVGGFGAPLFLFMAGVAVVLSASSKARRLGDVRAGARAVMRRGWEIFALAFLFRLQSFVLSPGSSALGLLKVDILNVMGPAIVGAAALWGACRRDRDRALVFTAVTIALAMLTPPVREALWVRALPDPLEWYLRPVAGRTNFTLLPWAGFVSAGALVGVALERARAAADARRTMHLIGLAGLATALAGYATSLLPPLFPNANFWTSSPTFFFLRCGVLASTLWVVSLAVRARGGVERPRPMVVLGQASLFVYWIHVEMVYGVLTRPLHRALTIGQALGAFVAFTLLLYAIVLAKNRLMDALARRRRGGAPADPGAR